MEQSLPFVTAMIVVRNEEAYIKRAILSFLNQKYPKNKMELLIIDGISEDGTIKTAKETVDNFSKKYEIPQVRYLQNPKKLLASGWNIGIKEAKGEFVVRIDAHAQADPYLIPKCINILLNYPDVVCAGGKIETEALTKTGKIIANVLSSPFGVGNAKFRYSEHSGYVDTVAYGIYRKSIFSQAGYFNESFQRNQDNDMHGRIKKCGGKFYLDTSVVSLYHSRESIKGMIKQAFGNGRWIIIGMKKSESKEGISLRHMIPFFFVLSNIILLIFIKFQKIFKYIFSAMYTLYFGSAVYFAGKKSKDIQTILKMCSYYWLLHVSYGLGSLFELFNCKNRGV